MENRHRARSWHSPASGVLNAAAMFTAIARVMYRRCWWVVALSGVALLGVIAALARGGTLTTGAIEGTESARTQRLVEGMAGLSGDSVVAAVYGSPEWTTGDPRFTQALRAVVERVKTNPDVQAVTSPLEGPPQLAMRFFSSDGHHALVVVRLKGDLRAAAGAFPRLCEQLKGSPLQTSLTGKPAFLW